MKTAERMAHRRSHYWFWTAVVLFVFLLPHPGIYVSNNASFYLLEAARLSSGEPPAFYKADLVARGPLLSYAIALLFKFTGLSVLGAFFLMKALYAAALTALFALSRSFFNRSAAYLATVLALFSGHMYLIGTYIDTNSLFGLLNLVFLIFLEKALKGRCYLHFILCGLFLALSFLTKETCVVFLGLFFIGALLAREPKTLRGLALGLGTFIAAIAPWFLYVYSVCGSLLPALGHLNPKFQEDYSSRLGFDVSANFISQFHVTLADFYRLHLTEITPAAPLLVVAFAASIIHIVRHFRDKNRILPDLICVSAILLYLPAPLSDISIGSAAIRQGFVIYLLLFALLGRWTMALVSRLLRGRENARPQFKKLAVPMAAAAMIALFVLGTGLFIFREHPSLQRYGKHFTAYRPVPEIKDRYTPLQKAGSDWIQRNVAADANFVVDSYLYETLNFYTQGRRLFTASFTPASLYEYEARPPAVFLMTDKNFRTKHAIVWVMDEPSILEHLASADYLAFSHKEGMLAEYFGKAPWAQLAYSNSDMHVYQITAKPAPLTEFKSRGAILVNRAFFDDLKWMRSERPDDFKRITGLLEQAGLDLDTLKARARLLSEEAYF